MWGVEGVLDPLPPFLGAPKGFVHFKEKFHCPGIRIWRKAILGRALPSCHLMTSPPPSGEVRIVIEIADCQTTLPGLDPRHDNFQPDSTFENRALCSPSTAHPILKNPNWTTVGPHLRPPPPDAIPSRSLLLPPSPVVSCGRGDRRGHSTFFSFLSSWTSRSRFDRLFHGLRRLFPSHVQSWPPKAFDNFVGHNLRL